MPKTEATLHMLCGRICAGKSTLAGRLAEGPGVVVLSEDHFLARLYPGEIETLGDYVRCAERLRDAVGPHVQSLLRAGVSRRRRPFACPVPGWCSSSVAAPPRASR